jgi:hypothetical protein
MTVIKNLGRHSINAAYMQTYMGGVSCPYICGRHLDHGVLLVGYGAAGFAPIRLKEKPAERFIFGVRCMLHGIWM